MRSIVERSGLISRQAGIPCVPVVALGRSFYPLAGIPSLREKTPSAGRVLDAGKALYHWADDFLRRLPLPARRNRREDESNKARTSGESGRLPSPRALIKQSGRNVLLGFLSMLLRIRAGTPMSPCPGDLLLMPDMFWGSGDPIRAAAVFRRKGGTVVPVIHDLIPLQFPEYCHEGTVFAFCRTLPEMVNLASGILTVSRSSSRDLEHYLADRFPDRSLPVGVFYPGADMHLKGSPALPIRSEFERAGIGDPFYLMVGSIQLHKGHLVVLETFERLWDQGFPGKLFVLGRLGGKGDSVLKRMRDSPRFGDALCVWHDANDAELDLLYSRTRALIMASYAEGFGLPLVEAMDKAVPVVASDLPVFREIAGDYPVYFTAGSPDDLLRALREMEDREKPSVNEPDRTWITWDESVKILVERVMEMHGK